MRLMLPPPLRLFRCTPVPSPVSRRPQPQRPPARFLRTIGGGTVGGLLGGALFRSQGFNGASPDGFPWWIGVSARIAYRIIRRAP